MVTITRHIFINIFQTENVSAVKFAMGYEKNLGFFVIPKTPKVGGKVEKIGLGSFKKQDVNYCPHFEFINCNDVVLSEMKLQKMGQQINKQKVKLLYNFINQFI